MAEYDEYSQGRFYGTLKSDYADGNKIVVLTPNGILVPSLLSTTRFTSLSNPKNIAKSRSTLAAISFLSSKVKSFTPHLSMYSPLED